MLFVSQVFFLPLSNTILSCFSDDSIFAWESDTLSCKYQLPVPDTGPKISYKAFAVTRWVFGISTAYQLMELNGFINTDGRLVFAVMVRALLLGGAPTCCTCGVWTANS